MPSLTSKPIEAGVWNHCHFPRCAARYAGFARLSVFALDSDSGALQLREVFVGAFSVVVVRPMSSDAREHSHVGCAAYACEKTTPWAASFSSAGVRNAAFRLLAWPAIIGTAWPFHDWSSDKMNRKLGAVADTGAGGAT